MTTIQKEIFEKYKTLFEKNKKNNQNNCSKNEKGVSLTPSQKLLSDWYKPGKSKNGLILYHSVGSGKTLTGISLMKNFEDSMNLLWVTRTTLKDDLDKALKMLPLKNKIARLSYKQFSNVSKIKNKQYFKDKPKEYLTNPFMNTFIVIDEAHKLFSKDLKPQEMHDISAIKKAIRYSYNSDYPCKIVLMSATPVTKDPREIIDLLNLIDHSGTSKVPDLQNKKQFSEKIQGMISYIDVSKDSSKFAQVREIRRINTYISDDSNKESCEKIYKDCRISGNSVLECKGRMDGCKKEKLKDKENNKFASYQSKVIKNKCDLNLRL